LADNDGVAITLQPTPQIEEAYHLLDDNDGNPIDLKQTMGVNEAYHLIDDNDGNPITLGYPLPINDAYHEHFADNIDTETSAWTAFAQTGNTPVTRGSWTNNSPYRNLINGADVLKAGAQIRVKLTGVNHTWQNSVWRASIMKRADGYDAQDAPTQLFFDGGTPNKTWDFGDIWTDWVDFDIEPGHDLLIHFDSGTNYSASGTADSVYPNSRVPSVGYPGSTPYMDLADYPNFPEWMRYDEELWYGVNSVTGNKYNWPGGAKPDNYIMWATEIQVRGTPYTANQLYIHRATHQVISETILLPYYWRTDFHEWPVGSDSGDGEYPTALMEELGYAASNVTAIAGEGSGNTSMATHKHTTTSITSTRFHFFEIGPGYHTDDVEILTKLKTDQDADQQLMIGARWFTNNTGYMAALRVNSDDVVIYRIDAEATWVNLNSAALSLAVDTWYWARFRLNGNNLYLKVWADGSAEPGGWTVTTTDSDYDKGFTGLMKRNSTGTRWCDYLEIATGGLTAQGTMLVDCCYHDHEADTPNLSVTAWSGSVPSEGTVAAARNYRMIIASADFDYGDSDGFVRLKLEAPPSEGVTINGASVGQRATSGELFDYDPSTVLHVRFTFDGGNNSKAIAAGQTVWSDWVPFAVDKTLDHLVHIFVNTAHKFPYNTTDWCYKSSAGNDQTMTADVKNYSLVNEFLFLVRLEVRARTALAGLAETYHDLDDNDGVAIDIFSINGAYHGHFTSEPLWWVNEAYHDHIQESPLWWIDEAYHLHDADLCDPVVILPTAEAFHLHFTRDPLWWVAEAYHLHDADNIIWPDLQVINEIYHLHDADSIIWPDLVLINGADHLHFTRDPLWWVAESYHLHDADRAIFIIPLIHTDAGEDYLELDDNDGNPIDLTGGFEVQESYHEIFSVAPLWWVDESYHDHVADSPYVFSILEAYHAHVADAIYVFSILKAYHDHTADALELFSIHGAYHLHDGENINLGGIVDAQEAYHLHFTRDPLWWVAEAYHDHIADQALFVIPLIHTDAGEDYLATDDNDGNPLSIFGLTLSDLEETYHAHEVDKIGFIIPLYHTDAGEDYLPLDDNDGNPLGIFGLTLSDLEEAYHLHFTRDPLWWVDEAYHLHDAENIDLDLGALPIAEAYHEIYNIAPLWWVDESYHEHVADILSFELTLDIAESDHLHFTRDPLWWVEKSYHEHFADNVALPGTLSINEAYHLHDADNVYWPDLQVIQPCYHEHFADEIGLGIWLTVQESSHDLDDNDADKIDLSLVLANIDSYHLHDADTITAWTLKITIADGDSEHYADTISLTNILTVAEAYHEHFADNIDLPLGVVGAYHSHVAENLSAWTITISIWELYHDIYSDYFILLPESTLPDEFFNTNFHSLTQRRSIKSLTVKRSLKT
jgi:hypothetical protein